ncbi:hypothetical protein B0T19DRAFT_472191 [Cercophora scortea]|uniref:Uncharacterized protein n=1 Tax=Cercophora scortea TaxID=314031 RepID=A0AAE0J5I3_9PEZI|nr:hypothetical protein B0T19DRAFT_472191 [Cercophora scortea]
MGDFSTNITLANWLPRKLTLVNKPMSNGYWKTAPPDTISANSTVSFQAKDSVGIYGSKGSFTYKVNDDSVEKNVNLSCNFEDPCGSNDNVCDASTDTLANLYNVNVSSFEKRTHPLNVTITISYKDISFNMIISDLFLISPVASVKNSKDESTVSYVGVYGRSKAVKIWDHYWSDGDVKDDSYSGVKGSYCPVATDATRSNTDLLAYLSYDYQLNDIPLRLVGTMGWNTVVDTGSQKLYHNQKTPLLSFPARNAGTAWGVAGDIDWKLFLQPTGQSLDLPSTRVEIYGLNKTLPGFYNNGVPVKLLRWVVMPAPSRLSGYTTHVATSVMSRTGYKFDSISGASGFGVTPLGANFNLSTWLKLMNSKSSYRVNQYDQSAAVQACLVLAPFPNSPAEPWAYLSPYGYINTTRVIGWSGNCNNPLFKEKTDKMELKINDQDRTAFVDYAFVLAASSKAVDATIGPHTGTETVSEYLGATIDTGTNLYLDESKQPRAAGTTSDVKYGSGINTLDSVAPSQASALLSPKARPDASSSSSPYSAHIETLMDLAINHQATSPPASHPSSSSSSSGADLRALEPAVLSAVPSARVLHRTTQLSPVCSETQIYLETPPSGPVEPVRPAAAADDTVASVGGCVIITITISVFSDHGSAVQGLADHLCTYAAPVERLFTRPEPGQEKGQLTLRSALGLREEGSTASERVLWVRGNKLVRVASLTEGVSGGGVEGLAGSVDAFLKKGEEEEIGGGDGGGDGPIEEGDTSTMPTLRGLTVVRDGDGDTELLVYKVGEQFSVFADIDGCALARVTTSSPAVRFIHQDLTHMKFSFQALEPAKSTKLSFIFMHQASHRVAYGELEVQVVDVVG